MIQTYFIRRAEKSGLNLTAVDNVKMEYHHKQSRLVLESELMKIMDSLWRLQVNNPDAEFIRVPND
jgi:hypothetical protein